MKKHQLLHIQCIGTIMIVVVDSEGQRLRSGCAFWPRAFGGQLACGICKRYGWMGCNRPDRPYRFT